jgi:drug/metabolite transporter (DMT)-like permease
VIAAKPESTLRGILLVCFAVGCFATMGAIVKFVSRELPMPQIVWGRYFFQMLLMAALFPRRLPTFLVSERKPLQVARGLLMLVSTLGTFTGVRYLPLADVTAISFAAPLLVTAFAALFLKEPVGPRRWAAVAVGFCGVLVIIRPGFASLHWAVTMPLMMAVSYAAYQIVTRSVRDAAPALTASFYTALVGTLASTLLLPFGWLWPEWQVWLLMAVIAGLGGFGHFLLIKAYSRAPAAILAPFLYVELLWVAVIAFLAFGEVPDRWTAAGAAIIVASNLYVLHRERVRARQRQT